VGSEGSGGRDGGIRKEEDSIGGKFIHTVYGRIFWGSIGTEIVNSGFTVHTGAERFWARRARTSIDVLGPGVLVGRVVVLGCSSEGSSEDSSLASMTGIFKIGEGREALKITKNSIFPTKLNEKHLPRSSKFSN
jgi:hypothetical protein